MDTADNDAVEHRRSLELESGLVLVHRRREVEEAEPRRAECRALVDSRLHDHGERTRRWSRCIDERYGWERTPTRMVPSGPTSTTTSVKCSAVSTFSIARFRSPRCSGVSVSPPPAMLYWPLSTWMLYWPLGTWTTNRSGVLGLSHRSLLASCATASPCGYMHQRPPGQRH